MSTTHSYAQRQRQPQLIGIAWVLGLHALLLWALLSGLARDVVRATHHTVEALLIADAPPAVAPTPPPAVKTPPPPKAPTPPPTPVPTPSTASAVAPSATSISAPVAPAAAPSAPASTTPVRVGASVAPGANCAKPSYPPASRRLEEEGTVSLRFLIGADGSVLQSEVMKSSGFVRLDEAARNALAKCQFRPGTVDGKPESSWASIQYTWRLE